MPMTDAERIACVETLMTTERGSPPAGSRHDHFEAATGYASTEDGPDEDYSVELWAFFQSDGVDQDWAHGGTFLFDGINVSWGEEFRVKVHHLAAGGALIWFVSPNNGGIDASWYIPDGSTSAGPGPDLTQLHQYAWRWHHLTGQLDVFFDGEQLTPAASWPSYPGGPGGTGFTQGVPVSSACRDMVNRLPSNATVAASRSYGSRPGFGAEVDLTLVDIRAVSNLHTAAQIAATWAEDCSGPPPPGEGGWVLGEVRVPSS